MKDKCLLTYSVPVPYENINRLDSFAWFGTEDELKYFCRTMHDTYGDKFQVYHAIHVIDSEMIKM